jgi:hypothetical protein
MVGAGSNPVRLTCTTITSTPETEEEMMALKKPQPKMDPEEFLTLFKALVEEGLADTLLPDFYDVIDARIRWYQNDRGVPPDAELYEALQVQRRFKAKRRDTEFVTGTLYGLLGSKYIGAEVELEEYFPDKRECRVMVMAPAAGLEIGEIYRVPEGALVPMGEN